MVRRTLICSPESVGPVTRSSSTYERELKGLLTGEPEVTERYGRGLPMTDREVLRAASRSPFLVVRAAGSFGFDLVALRSEFAFPLEVKASSSDTIRFSAASGRAAAQLEDHRKAVDRVGLLVVYAYRRVGFRAGDPWRLYATGSPTGRGLASLLRKSLPPVESTRDGNGILRWESGMPLVRFLERVLFWTAPSGAAP
jgi:hypothetical protein